MQLSDIPSWFAKRFGADATGTHIRSVPLTSADPNAASMALGFPPNTFVDIGAGGSPPDGRDFNGILNYLSAWAQWYGVGGPIPYSATVSAAGGYPFGAIVLSGTVSGRLYQSTGNNNTTNPDTGGAGWVILVDKPATAAQIADGTSNELVVTPLGLAQAGFDRVVIQNLVPSGGYRIYQSGFKECWGNILVPADGSAVWPLPVAHTSWIQPSLAVQQGAEINASQTTGISSLAGNAVTIQTARNTPTLVWVTTKGV